MNIKQGREKIEQRNPPRLMDLGNRGKHFPSPPMSSKETSLSFPAPVTRSGGGIINPPPIPQSRFLFE